MFAVVGAATGSDRIRTNLGRARCWISDSYQWPRPLTLFASTWRWLVLPILSRKRSSDGAVGIIACHRRVFLSSRSSSPIIHMRLPAHRPGDGVRVSTVSDDGDRDRFLGPAARTGVENDVVPARPVGDPFSPAAATPAGCARKVAFVVRGFLRGYLRDRHPPSVCDHASFLSLT